MKMNLRAHRCVVIVALLLAGCANPAGDRKTGVLSNDEYEWVTPLGSNIPVRVKKGQMPVNGSPTDSVSADQAANALHGGGGQIPATPGQKP